MLTTCQILEAFHHPYYNSGRSEIQNKMAEVVDKWLGNWVYSIFHLESDSYQVAWVTPRLKKQLSA